jgi:type VI secretion system protein ImpG
MTDKLLPYYNSELQYLRNQAEEFSKLYPHLAGNLRISGDAFDDPHVSRLMEAVAFLNARTACKLDDEFPELVDTLLNIVYPHYLMPFPSFSIIQLSPGQDMTEPYTVNRGTELESEPFEDTICRFRAAYPVTVYPIEVVEAKIVPKPFLAPVNCLANNAQSILKISLRSTNKDVTFQSLQPQFLRFYLNGLITHTFPLYELILNNTISISFSDRDDDENPVILKSDVIKQVGFDKDEGLLPYPPRSQLAYRVMSDFFAFPNKYLFFDIDLIQCMRRNIGNEFHLFLYLNTRNVELERVVNKAAFLLGCTPIVNLFEQKAEPITYSHNRFEHRVVPDARQQKSMVVHSINSVASIASDGRKREISPFYMKKSRKDDAHAIYWSASRKFTNEGDRVSDLFISLTSDRKLLEEKEATLSVDVLCSNGNIPSRLPFGGGHPLLKFIKTQGLIGDVSCIYPPTGVIIHNNKYGHKWRLISHLNLNHLSICGDNGIEAFKEMLYLYDNERDSVFKKLVDGIVEIEVKRGTARSPKYFGDPTWVDAICRGLEIHLLFDEALYPGSSCYLFASILERFVALYSTINSYTRLSYSIRSKSGVVKKWSPRVGHRYTL